MTTPEPPISPRGVPQMRTDWLADVARRLASIGFGPLRALGEDVHGHLTDVVDGRAWTFELIKFSAPHDTVVEFDAELWAPDDDRSRPTLRAGFALAPRWDEIHGEVALVRTEIGPRGAVTFDPENWMVTVPLGAHTAAAPVPVGVEAGEWSFDGGRPSGPAGVELTEGTLLNALPGTRLDLSGLAPVIAGEAVPGVVIGALEVARAKGKGVFGRLRGGQAPTRPVVTVEVGASGPIEAAWTGTGPLVDLLAAGLVLGDAPPVLAGEQLTFRGPDGVLTLGGRALRVALS